MFVGNAGEDDASEDSGDSGHESIPVHRPSQERVMKKPVTLDVNSLPWGNMKDYLANNIKKYAKSLDPTANWESQPNALRSKLFKQLYKGMLFISHNF